MKKATYFLATIIWFALLGSCDIQYEYHEREYNQELINPEKTNTYAFLGNSITHNGRYHSYFELFLLTRYPDVDFKFINAGVAGDQAGIALSRLQDDVLVHNPDLITVMFGMNDIGRNLYGKDNLLSDSLEKRRQENLSNYQINMDSLIRVISATEAHVVIFTPSIYEQNAENLGVPNFYGCNDALGKCADMVKELKRKYDTYLVDQFSVMDSLNNLLQRKYPDTTIVGPDRVHPQDQGHFIMATSIINQLDFTPVVATLDIDLSKKRVKCVNGQIFNLEEVENEIRFTYQPYALPFPIIQFQQTGELLSFNNELNREFLTVKGLPYGDYRLMIDSMEISVFNNQELKEGFNLSDFITPQQNYALEIARLVEQKREIISGKLRNIAFIEFFFAPKMRQASNEKEALEILDEKIKQIDNQWLKDQVKIYKEVKKKLPDLENEVGNLHNQISQMRKNLPEFEVILEKL